MGKKSAKPPDYTAAAERTAQGNKEAAIANANVNRVNQVTPFGQQTWSLRPGADPTNPQPGDYTATTELPQAQQELLDLSNQNSLTYGGLLQTGLTNLGPLLSTPVPGLESFDTYRGDIERALYDRGSRYAEPRFAREEGQTRDRLTAMGFQQGAEGYNRALGDFNERRDTYFADLQDRALLGSNQAAIQALQAQLGSRGQQFNELAALAAGGQINTPQFQAFGMAPAFAGPDYTQAAGQQFQAAQAAANASNAGFGNMMSGLVSLGSAALGSPWLMAG
jgi:hypothetical protein